MHPDWEYWRGKLSREFNFDDFKSALRFVNKVATQAEIVDHHPEILITDGFVKITFKAPKKSKLDQEAYQLATYIDEIE